MAALKMPRQKPGAPSLRGGHKRSRRKVGRESSERKALNLCANRAGRMRRRPAKSCRGESASIGAERGGNCAHHGIVN